MKSKKFLYLTVLCIALMLVFSYGIMGCDTDDDVVDDNGDAIVDDPDDDEDDVADEIPSIFTGEVSGVTVIITGMRINPMHELLMQPLIGTEIVFINNSDAPVAIGMDESTVDTCLQEGVEISIYSGGISALGVGERAGDPIGDLAAGETAYAVYVWLLGEAENVEIETVTMNLKVGDDFLVAEFDDVSGYFTE